MKLIKIKFFTAYGSFFFILLVWSIFAIPYFLQGKVPFPSTYQVNNFAPWSAYREFWGPVKNGAMPDIITQIYPWKKITIDTWRMGQVPLWNPYSFTGTPHLANYQSAVFSPFNVIFFIIPFIDAWTLLVLLQPLLAGIFTCLFARSIVLSKLAALISSISFMFCGFITVWMGYTTLGYAILFLPLALYAIEKFFATLQSRYLVLTTVSIPLSFFSGHFQISLYLLFYITAYTFYKGVVSHNKKIFLLSIFSIVFGLLISALQIIPSIEAYTQALRSTIFEKGEAIPWQYLPTFIAPDFFGNPVTRNNWFGHYAEWNSYIGIIPFVLALYAVLNKKKFQTLFFSISSLLAFLLAFDGSLLDLLVAFHIPVVSTSAASRIIVLYSFSFAVLAGMGCDRLIEDIKNKQNHRVYLFIILTGAMFLCLWTIIQFRLFLPTEKISIAKSNIILPTFLALSFYGIVITSFFQKKRITFLFCLILFLITFDMLRFVTKWMPFDSKHLVFPETSVGKYFTSISSYERVIGNLGGEATLYYKLPSLEGYDAVYPRRYGEFIASLSDGKVKNAYRSVVLFPKDGLYTSTAIQLLGVKYIIHKVSDARASWTFPFWAYSQGTFIQTYKDDAYEIFENKKVNPRAFFANEYSVVTDSQKIINTIFEKNFPLQSRVILEESPNVSLAQSSGIARIDVYTPNEVIITAKSSGNAFLVFTDNYYPGWQAFVDGKEEKIYRANHSFRAVFLPEGVHKIRFVYNPLSFRIGLVLATVGIMGSIVILTKRIS